MTEDKNNPNQNQVRPTITINVNRIYFEQFDAPAGEPDYAEIRREWEAAAVAVIEAVGFDAEVNFKVGYNPAPSFYVTFEDVTCEYAADEGNEECDGTRSYIAMCKLVEDYGKLIAGDAIEDAYQAATKKSEEFTKEAD